jgi:GH24 family phage-related lysozyme (muramidase)
MSFPAYLASPIIDTEGLAKNLNSGKDVAKHNFTDWDKAGGVKVLGLTNRRNDEFNLFSNGSYATP